MIRNNKGLSNANADTFTSFLPYFIFFVGIIVLYYVYQFLFGPNVTKSFTLLNKTQSAKTPEPNTPIVVTNTDLPVLYEGSEFTVSTWIYVHDWSYHSGKNKSIMNLGGSQFDTLRIYLGGLTPKVHVHLTTENSSAATPVGEYLSNTGSMRDTVYNTLQTESGLLQDTKGCDPAEIELQKWVHIAVAVSGKTVDVYVDGKLARSCVLPAPAKVDSGGYTVKLLMYGGFGGEISTTLMYDHALYPEAIYKVYMGGPEPITSLWGWLTSLLRFDVNVTVDTK